ncbi:DUF3263 domain-containing protein [uncultured Microbacterium sp.]|uniref:DUF3263 domain-containing protein n=1 Tax=uncultured Microbacterium sp. TaxID=191216 RepID=UPI0028E9BC7A|nr:DUF3263 domain-containing protein [uncultured Microbacterium sp.]
MPLSDRSRALLDFESRWNGHGAAKEEAIRRELALTPARYYQLLERVIDEPDAAAHDALLVHRLRRLRDERARERARRTAVPAARSGAQVAQSSARVAGGTVRTGAAR